MSTELRLLAFSVVLGIVQLFLGSITSTIERGARWNMGNREDSVPPLKGAPARVNLAFENFKETFPFFLAAVALVTFTGRSSSLSALGAQVYFYARLAYLPIYAAGITGLRSLVWIVSMVGIALMLVALL